MNKHRKRYLPSMLTLGRFYYWGKGVPTDVDKAIFWLQRAADTGSRAAHYILGKIYFTMIAPDKVLSGVHLCDEDFYKSQRKQLPPPNNCGYWHTTISAWPTILFGWVL